MDHSQDKVVWVDQDDNILGEVTRGEAHQKGILHRISVIYLVNDQGQILVQERSDGKLDHSSSGHVDVGESYLHAAQRELMEELGVEGVELEEIGRVNSFDQSRNHMMTIFLTKTNPGELNKEEVNRVFWANPQEILEDMQGQNSIKYTGGFIASLEYFLKHD